MTVYGFVGASGTGKSHRALELAQRLAVSHIIDDGLLIKENMVLAGYSAKREPSKLASVRRALFNDSDHVISVRNAISKSGLESIMILGTSVHMVDEIAKRLLLPPISRYIDIGEVATPAEIEAARRVRTKEGKHVIPAPTFALKKEFSGYFLSPLRRLVNLGIQFKPEKQKQRRGKPEMPEIDGARGKPEYTRDRNTKSNGAYSGERTVVRPTFSYLGGYTISRAALAQLIVCIVVKADGVVKVTDTSIDLTEAGLSAKVSLSLKYGCSIQDTLKEVIRLLRYEIDRQTSINVCALDVTAKSLSIA